VGASFAVVCLRCFRLLGSVLGNCRFKHIGKAILIHEQGQAYISIIRVISAMWPFRFAMQRKRGLRMMVVTLLSSSPKNGVEIMDGIEAITRGWWRPSPGSVYPLLERMEGEGTIKKRSDGRYELTAKANTELEMSFGTITRSPRTVEEAVDEIQSLISFTEDMARTTPDDLSLQKEKLRDFAERLKRLAG